MTLSEQYIHIRKHTAQICAPLQTEDYVVQPVVDVSPPKWHLGHTTWFFETFLLLPFFDQYEVYNADYNYVFNSYYETVGSRVIRTDRGNLSRPGVNEIYAYRSYVDKAMLRFLEGSISPEITELLLIGFNHEQQHQELLLADIKYILGNNPLFPAYRAEENKRLSGKPAEGKMIPFAEGIYEIGHTGSGFCFDNELGRHKVFLPNFAISTELISNKEYLQFIEAGGYLNFNYWHAEGWDWVKNNRVTLRGHRGDGHGGQLHARRPQTP